MTSGSQFRPALPPVLDSAEYAAAVDEVMQLGRLDSPTRTAEQTEIAIYWADGGGTFTPPGHWNQIAADVALARGNTLAENARLFALLNIAEADAGLRSGTPSTLTISGGPSTRFAAATSTATRRRLPTSRGHR